MASAPFKRRTHHLQRRVALSRVDSIHRTGRPDHLALGGLDASRGHAPHGMVGGPRASDHQAPGQQSYRSVERLRYDRLHYSGCRAGKTPDALRFHRQYFFLDGCLCGSSRHEVVALCALPANLRCQACASPGFWLAGGGSGRHF